MKSYIYIFEDDTNMTTVNCPLTNEEIDALERLHGECVSDMVNANDKKALFNIREVAENKKDEMTIKALDQQPCDDATLKDIFCMGCEYKEQEPYDFAKWVASEIFDEWEYNKDSFAEIACRKLAKLGIVRAKGDEWELIKPQTESEDIL